MQLLRKLSYTLLPVILLLLSGCVENDGFQLELDEASLFNDLEAGDSSDYAAMTINQLKLSADQGDIYAQFYLGHRYREGRGTTQDYAEAVNWYRRAAEAGLRSGQHSLGLMYSQGQGVSKDPSAAFSWMLRAAKQGHVKAQSMVGVKFVEGNGVVKNYEQAVYWFRQAAEQDFAEAQYNLGYMYQTGWGVSQDERLAFDWFTKAAEQKYIKAQVSLGALYLAGKGTKQDLIQAYAWLHVASLAGSKTALENLVALPPYIPKVKGPQATATAKTYRSLFGPDLTTGQGWIRACQNLAQCENLARIKYPDTTVDVYSGITWLCVEILSPCAIDMMSHIGSLPQESRKCFKNDVPADVLGAIDYFAQWALENPEIIDQETDKLIPLALTSKSCN